MTLLLWLIFACRVTPHPVNHQHIHLVNVHTPKTPGWGHPEPLEEK
jgi:hypothetical protein